jgi:hypothetical protein
MLWVLPRERLEAVATDPGFLALYDRAVSALDAAHGAANTWWPHRYPHLAGQTIAYFSAEFAITVRKRAT